MDLKEDITNIFWADAIKLINYEYFGDVISLDTTHCTNRDNRLLALSCGFNHFRGIVVFGVTLLYDEATYSFKWAIRDFF